MERVTVRTYRERNSHPKRFGADYVRESGERIEITTGERSSELAKQKATEALNDSEWVPFSIREGIIDVGQAWIDEPEPIQEAAK